MSPRLAPPYPTQGMVVKGQKDNRALGLFIVELPELFAWYTGMTLSGINIKIRTDDLMFIVKAASAGGNRVAFYTVPDMVTGYRRFYGDLKRGTIHWRVDKYK